ncbi:MAG: hypothetical protein ABIH23_35990 [bacterium]
MAKNDQTDETLNADALKAEKKRLDEQAQEQAQIAIDQAEAQAKIDAEMADITAFKRTREKEAFEAKSGRNMTLSEIGDGKGIEVQSEQDIIKLKEKADLEAFMNQVLEIEVMKDGTQGAYTVITPNVNGINQPIIRGRVQRVKRKYVEVLARSRITNYESHTPDTSKPDVITMVDITTPTYPFRVLNDPHPRGYEWLQAIMDQP